MSIYRRIRKIENPETPDTSSPAVDNEAPGVRNQWVEMAEPMGEQADQYSAWADRMRNKRSRNQEMITGEPAEEPTSYWTAETVFAESERIAQDEIAKRPDPLVIHAMLRTLDLNDGATRDDVVSAYKQLVKQHHPDRYIRADGETRAFHDERMREINTAYRSLRTLDLS